MTTHNTPDSKQEALLPQTTYKNKRVATDKERYRFNSELNTYLFNNCDHEHDGYPNHLACRPCVLDCLATIASRASVAAVEGESDYDYAVRLARHLMTSRFPVEGWAPLPTLSGVLSQIDNMIAGLTKPKPTMRDLALRHTEQGLRAAASSPAPAEPPPTPEQIVYNVAQRDPRFRKHLIEQLTAMGDEQDTGPLRTLQPLPPTGEQEMLNNSASESH